MGSCGQTGGDRGGEREKADDTREKADDTVIHAGEAGGLERIVWLSSDWSLREVVLKIIISSELARPLEILRLGRSSGVYQSWTGGPALHIPAVSPWASCYTSLSLCFLTCKMDMIGELASKGCLKDSSNMQIRYRAQGVALSNQSVKP